MGDGARFHQDYGSNAGGIRSRHTESGAVGNRTRCVRSYRGPGGQAAIRDEKICRLVDLDMVLEYALLRVATGEGDRAIRQKQLDVVIEPGEDVRSGGRERVGDGIVNLAFRLAVFSFSSSAEPPSTRTLPLGRIVASISTRGWAIFGPSTQQGA